MALKKVVPVRIRINEPNDDPARRPIPKLRAHMPRLGAVFSDDPRDLLLKAEQMFQSKVRVLQERGYAIDLPLETPSQGMYAFIRLEI
ncbi:MAG: hypothetical protein A2Z11_04715 [Candidatus Woykebacteria bacterium RBG_16_43_9]|uniref:Uncharacterized protein n=1 Tax=Candidatus Woykebacteria bacterium RBG_16_43_9 TaxID=1802596 RepID=A0A1G1WD39_9BACT|nr:MAG: hypothetical protein A2Z11_04715 [Candidatus Woykebacteria bacterium RBG_16_43_9]